MMNQKLKSILKAAAMVVVPSVSIFWLTRKIVKDQNEQRKFRNYIRETYGEGSKYENVEL